MDSHASEQIGLRIPPALRERLRKVAAAEANKVSAVVRRLLAKGLDDLDAAATATKTTRRRGARSGD